MPKLFSSGMAAYLCAAWLSPKSLKMNIRPAIPQDMPQVLGLIRELAEFEREPDAVVITTEDLVRDGFGENPLFKAIVAEEQGQIVGMALFYYRFSTWKGKTVHLEDLIVTQSMRNRGIGEQLYNKVIEHGKSQGVRRIEWNVLDWNVDAIRFYEKSGARVLEDWRVVHYEENLKI